MAGKARATDNGRKFEDLQSFAKALRQTPFELIAIDYGGASLLYAVHKAGTLVGYYGAQRAIYQALMLALNYETQFTATYIKHVLSRKIFPDEFLVVLHPRRLVIVEKKMQTMSGSVDEKLQTAPFKVEMFKKLLANFSFQVDYVYVLSEWFQHPSYRNIREYYENFTNVSVFVKGLDLDQFTLAEYFR